MKPIKLEALYHLQFLSGEETWVVNYSCTRCVKGVQLYCQLIVPTTNYVLTITEDKRTPTEPPIPGYQGYVPRINTTELGLGCRYHQSTKNGLEMFKMEADHRDAVQRGPVNLDR